nr:non-reducing polyketide synthase mapc [Quercus suber]
MIHGGSHVISTRKDIRDDQTQILLDAGFIPVSVDYRLCPETTVQDGAMQDVRDAFHWAREVLPTLPLVRPDIHLDGGKVVAVGWSSGGHLAMSLAWTVRELGIKPPEAILTFYGPSDYEDPFWTSTNLPFGQPHTPPPAQDYHFLYDGLADKPIVGYSPDSSKRALGGWMSLEDPRCRLILHMNWEAKTLPVLIHGLNRIVGTRCVTEPAFPSTEQIRAISPLAQIRDGNYTTPTFFVHGTRDDLVPWQASQRTHEALKVRGVDSEICILEDALHLFDLYPTSKKKPAARRAVSDGYRFLSRHCSAAAPSEPRMRSWPRMERFHQR